MANIKKLLIMVVSLLLVFLVAFSQSKGELGDAKSKLNYLFITSGLQVRLIDVKENSKGLIDFYAVFNQTNFDEKQFAIEMAAVIGATGGWVQGSEWKADRLYFCNPETLKPWKWISTADCIRILDIVNKGAMDDLWVMEEILNSIHNVK